MHGAEQLQQLSATDDRHLGLGRLLRPTPARPLARGWSWPGGGGGDVRMSGRLRDRAADVVLARFSLGEISAQLTALNDRPQDQVNTVTNMVAVLGSPFKPFVNCGTVG